MEERLCFDNSSSTSFVFSLIINTNKQRERGIEKGTRNDIDNNEEDEKSREKKPKERHEE